MEPLKCKECGGDLGIWVRNQAFYEIDWSGEKPKFILDDPSNESFCKVVCFEDIDHNIKLSLSEEEEDFILGEFGFSPDPDGVMR